MICFAFIHIVLNTSLKWILSLSIYLIVCTNAWIALCPDVAKVKYDIRTNVVLNSKIQDYEILPELDWKYQVYNWIIGFSLDIDPEWYLKFEQLHWRYKMVGLCIVPMSLKEVRYLTLRGSTFEKLKRWLNFVGMELKIKFYIWIKLF